MPTRTRPTPAPTRRRSPSAARRSCRAPRPSWSAPSPGRPRPADSTQSRRVRHGSRRCRRAYARTLLERVTDHTPFIDYENLPVPTEGFLVTHFLAVRSVARSRAFYSEVLGGQVVL